MDKDFFVDPEVCKRRYPQLARLTDLMDAGWVFLDACPQGERPVQLDGFRTYPGFVTDAICIRSATDAQGCRTVGDENGIVKEFHGTLDDVINGLLELPAPDHPNAPKLVKGTAPRRLWLP